MMLSVIEYPRLIKRDMSIDYYVVYHPWLIRHFFEVLNGKLPRCFQRSNNIYRFIQSVIEEHNDGVSSNQRSLAESNIL